MSTHVFVTPTFRGDVDRFAFLRESMAAVGVTTPHVAIVDHEDLELVRRRVSGDNLTILSSRDVLTPAVERRRRLGRVRWSRVLPANGRVVGWMAQQLIKLAVVDHVDAPMIVTLDSDSFFLRAMPDSLYAAEDGRPVLHEFVDLPAGPQPRAYLDSSEAVLGLVPGTADRHRSYVSLAVPMWADLVRALRGHLDERHGGWARALNAHRATEYTTYGLFARHVQHAIEVDAVDRRMCAAFFAFDQAVFETELAAAAADPTMHLGMVHSHLGVPPDAFEPIVRRAWRAAADGGERWDPPRGVPYGRI